MGQFRLSLSKLSPRLDHRAICRVRCRSVAAAGDLLFFASPKKPKEKKGDPGAFVPFASLRGNLGARSSRGPARTRLRLRQSRALIRLALRSSAHSQGVRSEFGFGEH